MNRPGQLKRFEIRLQMFQSGLQEKIIMNGTQLQIPAVDHNTI